MIKTIKYNKVLAGEFKLLFAAVSLLTMTVATLLYFYVIQVSISIQNPLKCLGLGCNEVCNYRTFKKCCKYVYENCNSEKYPTSSANNEALLFWKQMNCFTFATNVNFILLTNWKTNTVHIFDGLKRVSECYFRGQFYSSDIQMFTFLHNGRRFYDIKIITIFIHVNLMSGSQTIIGRGLKVQLVLYI